MDLAERSTTPVDVDRWDWKAALKAEERSLDWLARRTERSVSAVNAYSAGRLTPPRSWLLMAAQALGIEVASDD